MAVPTIQKTLTFTEILEQTQLRSVGPASLPTAKLPILAIPAITLRVFVLAIWLVFNKAFIPNENVFHRVWILEDERGNIMKNIRRLGTEFTISEVVVVAALLALLAAVLLPAFNSVRQKGRNATCLSNLHQIGLATRLYVDDFDGHYPYAANVSSGEEIDELPLFKNVINPYLKNKEVFHCPSDVNRRIPGADHIPINYFKAYGISYGYNNFLVEKASNKELQSMLLANSSNAWLCSDMGTWHGMVSGSDFDSYRQVVYLDLHVKRSRTQQIAHELSKLERLLN